MLRDRQHFWRRLNLAGDLLLTWIALSITLHSYRIDLSTDGVVLLYLLTAVIWTLVLFTPANSYFYRMKTVGAIIRELYWALSKSFLAFTAAVFFLRFPLGSDEVVLFFLINGLSLSIFRLVLLVVLRYYRHRGRSNRNVIIIGTNERAQRLADRILDNRNWGMRVIGFLDYHRTGLWRYRDKPLLGHPDGLPSIIANRQVDYIFIAVDVNDLPVTNHAFSFAEEMGVNICFMADIFYHPISKAYPTRFMNIPALMYSSEPADRMQLVMKECMDRAGGLVALVLALPVMLVTALLIKLEDAGPVFYHQIRSGKNGRPFTMYKFRTMVADADSLKEKLADKNDMTGPVFKMKRDPRITRIGSVLRKLSIDEVPQFFNVLRGDMSLVGPRPPLPEEVLGYDRWQRRKLSVKPGLTCLWQINGRNAVDFEHWMKLDLEYIDNWSIWLDTKILVRTIPAVLRRDGAF